MAEQFIATKTQAAHGGVDAIADMASAQQEAKGWAAVLGIAKSGAEAATALMQTESKALDSQVLLQAGIDAADDKIANSELDAAGRFGFYNNKFREVEEGTSGNSDIYNRAYLNAINADYVSSGKEHNEIQTAGAINSYAEAIHLGNPFPAASSDITTEIDRMSTESGIDKARIRDAYMAKRTSAFTDDISLINDLGTLDEYKTKVAESNKILSDPKLFGSKSTGRSGSILKAEQTKYNTAITAAQSRIKKANKTFISDYENKYNAGDIRSHYPNGEHPVNYEDKYETPEAFTQAVTEYNSHQTALQEANTYDFTDVNNYKGLSDDGQKLVKQDFYNEAYSAWDKREGEHTAVMIVNNPQINTDFIAAVKSDLFSTDPDKSNDTMVKLKNMESAPNGAEALRKIFTGKEYNEYKALDVISKYYTNGNMAEAREYYANNPAQEVTRNKKENKAFFGMTEDVSPKIGKEMQSLYNTLRGYGVDHDTAMDEAEKVKEIKQELGSHVIQGTKDFTRSGKKVNQSVESYLTIQNKDIEDSIMEFDSVTGDVTTYDNLGFVKRIQAQSDIMKQSTTVEAFRRAAYDNAVSTDVERRMETFSNFINTRVVRKGEALIPDGVIDNFVEEWKYFGIDKLFEGDIDETTTDDKLSIDLMVNTIAASETDVTDPETATLEYFQTLEDIFTAAPDASFNDVQGIAMALADRPKPIENPNNDEATLGYNMVTKRQNDVLDKIEDSTFTTEITGGSRIFASGRYQIIPTTMQGAIDAGVVSVDDKYTEDTQDKLMVYLLETKRPRIRKYFQEDGDEDAALLALSKEWASMPNPATNKSYYPLPNRSGIDIKDVRSLFKKVKATGNMQPLIDLIAEHESAGKGYNAYNAGTSDKSIKRGKTKYKLTDMTIGDILKASEN